MSFYIIVGIITAVLAQLSVNLYDRNKVGFSICFLVFILFPSIIEGCRNPNIGSDMLGYGSAFFYNAAQYNNVYDLLADLDSKEYAYHIMCYICAKIGTINLYMFVAALIKMIMLALTCIYFRKKTIVWMAVLGYMLFFYWYGFSLMRQSLALCISMYSLTYLFEKKYVLFSVWLILAYFFHNSAVFMFYMIAVLYMAKFKHGLLYVSLGVGAVYLLASVLFVFIASSGLFGDSKMDLYLDSGVDSAKTNILLMMFFVLMPIGVKTKDRLLVYYIRACALLGLMFLSLSSLFEVAFRVSFYQMMPLLFFVPALIQKSKVKVMQVGIAAMFICLFLVHIIVSASHGMADTVPYRSIILDSLL